MLGGSSTLPQTGCAAQGSPQPPWHEAKSVENTTPLERVSLCERNCDDPDKQGGTRTPERVANDSAIQAHQRQLREDDWDEGGRRFSSLGRGCK